MRNFPTRPKGTLMSGTFRSSTEAERALRVLRNAGFARADVVADAEAVPGAPILLVVDAAATGAFRAAEILEEHGAKIQYESEPVVTTQAAPFATAPLETPPVNTGFATPFAAERKPRVRKRNRSDMQAPAVPPDEADVLIVTRGIESLSRSS